MAGICAFETFEATPRIDVKAVIGPTKLGYLSPAEFEGRVRSDGHQSNELN
jgi:hypothetical protein